MVAASISQMCGGPDAVVTEWPKGIVGEEGIKYTDFKLAE